MNVLVTGGAGYIGSHFVLELLMAGHDVVVLDNCSNSSPESIARIGCLTGRMPAFIIGDICDSVLLDRIFVEYKIDTVAHFAGLKAVGESVVDPIRYYENNVSGSLILFRAMAKAEVFSLVFSSSATVYGRPELMPISEDSPVGIPSSPYGQTKVVVENVLKDMAFADNRWSIAILRYFNPIGAHRSGVIGEAPNGIPNNLLPYLSQVAVGKLDSLSVFGNDYSTVDGSGIRDYVHVVDLVKGHIAALNYLNVNSGFHVWNLGSGVGYSVFQMVSAFESVIGRKIPIEVKPRRLGDVPICWADTTKAQSELGWTAKFELKQMIEDAWRWQVNNPNGYER